jgi:cbb3-type cytochrome oxidase maturation protein
MNIVFLLIICSVSLGALFLFIFLWWVKSGQADDLETPAHRILFDENTNTKNLNKNTANSYE